MCPRMSWPNETSGREWLSVADIAKAKIKAGKRGNATIKQNPKLQMASANCRKTAWRAQWARSAKELQTFLNCQQNDDNQTLIK